MAENEKRPTRSSAKENDDQNQQNRRVTRSESAAARARKAETGNGGRSDNANRPASIGTGKKRKNADNDGRSDQTAGKRRRKLPDTNGLDTVPEEDENANEVEAPAKPPKARPTDKAAGDAVSEKDEEALFTKWRQGWDDLLQKLESSPKQTKEVAQALRDRAEQVHAFDGLKIPVLDLSQPLNRVYFEALRRKIVEGESKKFDAAWRDSPDFDEAAYEKARNLLDEGHDPIWPTPREPSQPAEPAVAVAPQRWKSSWETIRAELESVAGDELFRHVAPEFDRWLDRADALQCKDGAPAMEAPEWVVGQSPVDYVNKTLRKAVMAEEHSFFGPIWEEAIEREQSAGNESRVRELQQRHAEMNSKLSAGERPYFPARVDCLSNWVALTAHNNFDKNDAEMRVQFARQLEKVNKLDRYDIYISPPPWTLELSWAEYLPILGETVQAERTRYHDLVWDKERYPDGPDKPVDPIVEEQFKALQDHLRKGGDPYMPGEPVPAIMPAPPKVSCEAQQQQAINIGFGTPPELPGRWTFRDTLGQGGYGHAGIWVQYNDHGRRVARVAVKESYILHGWDDGRLKNTPEDDPYEVIVSQALMRLSSNHNIVRYVAHAIYRRLDMFRIYMEYCEHGDLQSMLNEYRLFGRSTPVTATGKRIQKLIPVRVMWAIFESMVSALCLMHHGYLPNDAKNKPRDWPQWVHLDLKPGNVLLSKPRESRWAEIPTFKVTDFGMAYPMTDRLSHDLTSGGTRDYRAPEQCVYADDSNENPHPLNRDNPTSLKCDIYGLGRMMVALMNLDVPQIVTFTTPEQETRLNDAAEAFYPEPMKIVVKQCVRITPNTRPNVEDVFAAVRKEVERFPGPDEIPLKLQGRGAREVILYRPDPYVLWAPEL